jgi:hypothetical protein
VAPRPIGQSRSHVATARVARQRRAGRAGEAPGRRAAATGPRHEGESTDPRARRAHTLSGSVRERRAEPPHALLGLALSPPAVLLENRYRAARADERSKRKYGAPRITGAVAAWIEAQRSHRNRQAAESPRRCRSRPARSPSCWRTGRAERSIAGKAASDQPGCSINPTVCLGSVASALSFIAAAVTGRIRCATSRGSVRCSWHYRICGGRVPKGSR